MTKKKFLTTAHEVINYLFEMVEGNLDEAGGYIANEVHLDMAFQVLIEAHDDLELLSWLIDDNIVAKKPWDRRLYILSNAFSNLRSQFKHVTGQDARCHCKYHP